MVLHTVSVKKKCAQTDRSLPEWHAFPWQRGESDHSLEVGKDDETNEEGHDGQAVTHHGHVVETERHLQAEKALWFTEVCSLRAGKRSGGSVCCVLPCVFLWCGLDTVCSCSTLSCSLDGGTTGRQNDTL